MAKGKGKELHLPGSFNSFPRGPKPAHTAPHAQRHIEAKGQGARGPQRQIEKGKHEAAPKHSMEQRPRAERAPQHKISDPARPPRSPKHTPTKPNIADTDPFGNFIFVLEIDGTEVAHFMECSGLKNASEVFELAEGGFNGHVHKFPSQSKWENIVLKYATSVSTFLLEWRDQFIQDQYSRRRSGSIAIKNNENKVVRRFHFDRAWPVSWEGPSLISSGSDLAIETLEIAHDGLTISAN